MRQGVYGSRAVSSFAFRIIIDTALGVLKYDFYICIIRLCLYGSKNSKLAALSSSDNEFFFAGNANFAKKSIFSDYIATASDHLSLIKQR